MKKFILIGTILSEFILGIYGATQAALTPIGTAQFGGVGTKYSLIWDDNNNGNSIVWLDYTSGGLLSIAEHENHISTFDSDLTLKIDPTYSVLWTSSWRLPETVDGPLNWKYDGTGNAGYWMTIGEIAHLYYEELGNLGAQAPDGSSQLGYGFNNKGPFINLRTYPANQICYGTVYSLDPSYNWKFIIALGEQNKGANASVYSYNAWVVRTGEVSIVPIPGSVFILGASIACLVALRRNF